MSNKQFSTLSAVKAAGLVETLKSSGPFTVFAPTNAGGGSKGYVGEFAKARKQKTTSSYPQASRCEWKSNGIRRYQENYHQPQQTVLKSTLMALGVTVSGAKVVSADLITTNGVIHVIDKVLLP